MRPALLTIFLLLALCAQATRVIHVIVALADNQHQAGPKLSGVLGNGQAPAGNQLWGAGYGVRSHFDWAKEWVRIPNVARPEAAHILERAIWKHRDSTIYLVADAYDGRHLREATGDLLLYASGSGETTISAGGTMIPAGGGASLVVFAGHNGMMDHKLDRVYRPQDPENDRQVIILASLSRGFFANPLRATGARPLLWTTGLIVPEAYTLRDALLGYVTGESDEQIRERAAKAYDQYQRSGMGAARRAFVTGW
jgi:hypothetical protein